MEAGTFERNVPGTTCRLKETCVGVAGCGGLGSNIAVSLVRAGVGKLILVDSDVVELSNLNRQHFFLDDVGEVKVEALARHLRCINPDVSLRLHNVRLTPDMVGSIFGDVALLLEAFDLAENKHFLIESWCRAFGDRPIVCGNGLGGYGRTADLQVMRAGNIYFCGDGTIEGSAGLSAPRVAQVANMQANVALELLLGPFEYRRR